MATLLSIAQDAAREAGFGTSGVQSVIGNNDEFAQRVRGVLDRTGRELVSRHDWSTLVQIDNTVTTVASTASYTITSSGDYSRLLPDAVWDQTNQWKMPGTIGASEWRMRNDAITPNSQLRKVFRLDGSNIVIHPTPSTSGEVIAVPYVSSFWCQDSSSNGQTSWQADTDTNILDEELLILGTIWRILKGRAPYFEEKEDYERRLETKIAQDISYGMISLADGSQMTVEMAVNLGNLNFGGFDGGFG